MVDDGLRRLGGKSFAPMGLPQKIGDFRLGIVIGVDTSGPGKEGRKG